MPSSGTVASCTAEPRSRTPSGRARALSCITRPWLITPRAPHACGYVTTVTGELSIGRRNRSWSGQVRGAWMLPYTSDEHHIEVSSANDAWPRRTVRELRSGNADAVRRTRLPNSQQVLLDREEASAGAVGVETVRCLGLADNLED